MELWRRTEDRGPVEVHRGSTAAVILSDFGADVIKVEPPTGDL